jgi:hypothetical protein
MKGFETPISRRQLLASSVAAGTSLAGCSSVSNDEQPNLHSSTNNTIPEEQQHESSDPLDIAETNIKAAFERLNEIAVIEDDTIIYADTGQDPNYLAVFDNLDAITAALETAREQGDPDTTRFKRIDLGATLVEQKLLTYCVVDSDEGYTASYTVAIRFAHLKGAIDVVDKLFKDIKLATESAHRSFDAIEKLETLDIEPPAYYAVDRIAAESAVFVEFEEYMTPWLNGLKAWPNALLWGSDGVRRVNSAYESTGSAIESYTKAIEYATAAQDSFKKRDGKPPLYREPISHATCRLSDLLDTYRTVKQSLEHRRNGDAQTAGQLLVEAHGLADSYQKGCHPGNAALVPPMD